MIQQQALSAARMRAILDVVLGAVYGPPRVRRVGDCLEMGAGWTPAKRPAHGDPADYHLTTHCSGLVGLVLAAWLGRPRDYSAASSSRLLGYWPGVGRLRDVADWSLGRRPRRYYWTSGKGRLSVPERLPQPVCACQSYHHAWLLLDLGSPWLGGDGVPSLWRLAADGWRGPRGYSAGAVSFRPVAEWAAESTRSPDSRALFRIVGVRPEMRGLDVETLRPAKAGRLEVWHG